MLAYSLGEGTGDVEKEGFCLLLKNKQTVLLYITRKRYHKFNKILGLKSFIKVHAVLVLESYALCQGFLNRGVHTSRGTWKGHRGYTRVGGDGANPGGRQCLPWHVPIHPLLPWGKAGVRWALLAPCGTVRCFSHPSSLI